MSYTTDMNMCGGQGGVMGRARLVAAAPHSPVASCLFTGRTIVTQADRDVAADIWANYVAKVGEQIVEHQMRKGSLDDGLPSILAAHRTNAESDAPNLLAALQCVMDILGRAESNASGMGAEWDYVGPRVAACRAALAKATSA